LRGGLINVFDDRLSSKLGYPHGLVGLPVMEPGMSMTTLAVRLGDGYSEEPGDDGGDLHLDGRRVDFPEQARLRCKSSKGAESES
jgi:hypothetical protein